MLVGSHLSASYGCQWWLALYPSGWTLSLCLRPLFAPCHYGRASWWSSLRPRVFGVLGSLQCSPLSDVMVTCPPPCLLLTVYSCPWCFALDPSGWGSSLCLRLLFTPCSCRRVLSWWSSLRQRVFGRFWLSPLFFHGRWYGYMTTCITLDPVRRLSFGLGPISFWMGFALCLRFLFAPCSCWRAYWWSSLRLRVFESSGLSPGFFPFGGPAPVSHLFLGLRPCRSRSPIPSLAPSWWSPCPHLRWALLTLSCYVLSVPSAFSLLWSRLSIPFAMSPLSLTVSVLCERFLRSPWGSRWLHLYRLTPVLVSLRDLDVHHLELRSVFPTFPARRSTCIHGDKFISLPDLYLSQPQQSHWVRLF